ncbi:hypothetical protein Pcinc_040051 [Petrolisthes cinctipes]|uniref:Uncharacterized protein n=1 Tax=Petrolisthes cinctipes TaxID=88211 RepID=A0AAE1EIF7_PETCI|nr:hypothetical protein Pcinc_040051 [Petrolisthes cinctipes]
MDDKFGIDRILALLHLLNESRDPIYNILLSGFKSAHYITENHDKVKPEMNLKELLLQINTEVKRRNRNLGGNNSYPEISNIAENEKILSKVLVKDLLSQDGSQCKALHGLDLNFVFNILLHRLIRIELSPDVSTAIAKLKKIRTNLCHAGSNYSKTEFETVLEELLGHLGVLYQNLGWAQNSLNVKRYTIMKEAESKQTPVIFNEVRGEVHQWYSCHHILPVITHDVPQSAPVVIEDLVKFVEEHQFHHPIVVCGHHDADMAYLLACLATSLVKDNSKAFSLVLLLEELDDGSASGRIHQYDSIEEGLRLRVYHCLQSLAPITWEKYGPETIMTVLKVYQLETLYLVGWKMKLSGPLRSEMEQGTWVLAQREEPPQVLDWIVLTIQGYTEVQVEKFLEDSVSRVNMNEVVNLYRNCQYKPAITSVELIKAFGKMTSRSSLGTYWEFGEAFIQEKLQSPYSESHRKIRDLGKIAFQATCKNSSSYSVQELEGIPKEVRKMFLDIETNVNRASFIYAIARDYLIANYISSNPRTACKNWMKNPKQFKSIFCFTCFLWSKNRCVIKDNLAYIEQFLLAALGAPPKESDDLPKHTVHIFTDWEYVLDVDKACTGQKYIRKKLASALAHFPVWVFSEDLSLDNNELCDLEKIIKLVKLDDLAVTIKLENKNVSLLTSIWKKLRHIKELQICAEVIMVVKHTMASSENLSKIEELLHCIVGERKVYITRYNGPLFFQEQLYFLKCPCLKYLSELDVTVYDVQSLLEALSCEGHKTLQNVSVRVNLKESEQEFPPTLTITIPGSVKLYLTIRYFKKIENLFKCFDQKSHLTSLIIYDVIVSTNFSLDISLFENLESFSLKFCPSLNEKLGHEVMEEESGDVISRKYIHPRSPWMMNLNHGMKLPVRLKRLLLRNMDFCNDSNLHLLKNLQQRHSNLGRLVVLDCMLTIYGARQVLRKGNQEELAYRTKKMCVNPSEESEMKKLVDKNPRLSKDKRLKLQQKKPPGKEFIVDSEVSLCSTCQLFPCCCTPREGEDIRDTLDQLSDLIVDIYSYDILTFSYASNVCTVRKNVCGDLSVRCVVSDLTDNNAAKLSTSSSGSLHRFFLHLVLAQTITFTGTKLSSEGVLAVIRHLHDVKKKYGPGQKGHVVGKYGVEPFNLTVETIWQPTPELNKCLRGLVDELFSLPCISVFVLRCVDKNRCVTLKKTFKGVLLLNGKENKELRSLGEQS